MEGHQGWRRKLSGSLLAGCGKLVVHCMPAGGMTARPVPRISF